MIEGKKGSTLRVISGVFGSILFLVALYFLDLENFLQATIFGMIGIILITISFLPFIRAS